MLENAVSPKPSAMGEIIFELEPGRTGPDGAVPAWPARPFPKTMAGWSLRYVPVCAGDGSSVRRKFREKLLGMLAKRPPRIEKTNGYHRPQLNDYAEKRARAYSGSARTLRNGSGNVVAGTQGRWRKGPLAAMIQKETTMRLDWITEQLNMGTRAGTCRLAAESGRRLATARGLRKHYRKEQC